MVESGTQPTECALLEIRGVGGATPEEILGGPAVQVAGDKLAGFYRPDPDSAHRANVPEGEGVIVEAYEWGRLTSGTWSTALWWILLPFTLINVAGWTFHPLSSEFEAGDQPPLGPRGRAVQPARSTLWWGRLVIVAGGLALTGLYAAWAAVIGADLIGLTCGGDDTCSAAWYMGPFRWFGSEVTLPDGTTVILGHPTWRLAAGMTLAAALMFLLMWFIRRTQDHLEGFEADPRYRRAGDRNDARLTRNTNLEDGGFWYRWGEYRRLFRSHLATIVAVLGGIAGYGYSRLSAGMPDPAWPIWITVALFIVMVYLVSGSERFHANPTAGRETERWKQYGWTAVHTAVATGSFALVTWFTERYGNAGDRLRLVTGIRWLSTLLWVTAVALFVLLAIRTVGVRLSASTKFASASKSFGMPLITAALAAYLSGVGWGAVTHLLGRYLVGTDELVRGSFETSLVDLFVLALAVTAAGIAVYRLISGPDEGDVAEVLEEYEAAGDSSDRVRAWARSIASARWTALLPTKADRLLGALVALLIVAQFIQTFSYEGLNFAFWRWSESSFGIPLFGVEALRWLHPVASTAVVLYLFPGADIIRRMASSRDTRRQLGKIWDVLSFWPRRFHPLAAPCYAERAVPEFRDRIKHHLSRDRAVVVSAHSQGTVIALAALLQIAGEAQERSQDHPDEPRSTAEVPGDTGPPTSGWYRQAKEPPHLPTDHVIELAAPIEEGSLGRLAFVTFGSPLSSLYGPFFPSYFGLEGRFQAVRDRLAACPTGGGGTDRGWHSFYRPTDFIGREVFIEPGGALVPAPHPPPDVRLREARHVLFRNEAHSNYEFEPRLREWVLDLLTHLGALTQAESAEQKQRMEAARERIRPG